MSKRKILLIGWDAADWQIINPILDAGKMPALSSIINEGVIGNIATLEPVISPILWTSIATGKLGDKHGILGFSETTGISGGVHPVLSTSRKTKSIWNILQQSGYKSHQIGWWATHPAEKLSGVSVSNFYGKSNFGENRVLPPPEESVHPTVLKEVFNSFRIAPTDITGDLLYPFVPELHKIDQSKDKRLIKIAEALAECTNYHAVATWILENEEWDFLSLYQVAIDTICHRFMHYFPPQLNGVSNQDYTIYKGVIEGFYIYHDMMLERLLKLAGPDVTVVLVSDHGFNTGNQRFLSNPKEPAGIAYDHRPYGFFCIKGPGIKKDERVYGASLLDVTPTILAACGLPIGEDMDGKPLIQIFEKPETIKFIKSWDKLEGDSGMYNSIKQKHYTTGEELKQLIDLGYIEDPGENMQDAVDKTTRETQFNLGRIYMFSNRYEQAAVVFEELSKTYPDEPRFKIRLASTYQRLGKNANCQELINELRNQDKKNKENNSPEAKDSKSPKPWKVSTTVLDMLEANNLLAQNKPYKALDLYKMLEKEMPANAKVNIQKARALMALLKYTSAIQEFKKCLEKDPDNAAGWVGLANCYLLKERYEEAADAVLNAIGLNYFYPRAHYILGQSLFELEDIDNAIKAFEVCLTQNPGYSKARNQLISIYKNFTKNSDKLNEHLNFFKKRDKEIITIVSGIPRSGTSLMMQMLQASKFSILSDTVREADASNPKGYFEYELVKRLAVDNSWLKNAYGKVLKVVSQQLFHLPDEYNYRIIFMTRDIGEIIHSQQKMVSLIKKKEMPTAYPSHLEIAYKKNLDNVEQWAKMRANVDIQYFNYTDFINNPDEGLTALQNFMNEKLDKERMKKIIDVNLYRSKV